MNYENLIKTVSEIYNNDEIEKKGLILVYQLDEKNHKDMTEELFYRVNPLTAKCEYTDEFEVEIGGVLVKFIKKIED